MPTALKTFRSLPVHCGHSVSEASEKDCTVSNSWPHSVQAYWYVGTTSSRCSCQALALLSVECQEYPAAPGRGQMSDPTNARATLTSVMIPP
jgi:hypothetical protein